MYGTNGKRFINNPHQWLYNTGIIECKATNQFGRVCFVGGEDNSLTDVIHFADMNRWDRVVFEFDSATLVHALSSPGHGDSKFYVIVSSVIYQLSLHSNFEVKLVRRQVNMVAHNLARATCSWASHRIFLFLSFLY